MGSTLQGAGNQSMQLMYCMFGSWWMRKVNLSPFSRGVSI
jgi:hypothetical protein